MPIEEGLDIYFSDLTPEAQSKVLEFFKVNSPKEWNWDCFALFTLYYEPPEGYTGEDNEQCK
jgi:hypothetical protein